MELMILQMVRKTGGCYATALKYIGCTLSRAYKSPYI
jgi:hypothetical protein